MVEKLIVICELKAESIKKVNLNGLKKEMKAAVNRCFSVNLHDVAFIKPGTIQKTTSGKVSRALIKENYLSGELKTLASDLKKKEKKSENTYNKPAQVKTGIDSKDIKPFLINCIKNKLEGKREFIDTQKSIFFFGFDSVKIIELFHDLEKNFNCEFPVEIFFKDSSIDELAELLRLTVEGKPISH